MPPGVLFMIDPQRAPFLCQLAADLTVGFSTGRYFVTEKALKKIERVASIN